MRRILLFALACLLAAPLCAAAGETVNDITGLNPIVVDKVVAPQSVNELSRLIAAHHGPVSIGGGRFSQGGQTACAGCLFIDMTHLNRILALDEKNRRITVQAGVTWRQMQEAIDTKGLSPKIMQSFSNFTVGGSISVNCHGRYVGQGPLVNSVISLKLVLADGSVMTASRSENRELFVAVVGGYGGIAVIAEATLDLADNTALEKTFVRMPVTRYRAWYEAHIRGSKTAVLHSATLYPPDYTRLNVGTADITTKPVTVPTRLASQARPTGSQLAMLDFVTHNPFGKWFREAIYDRFHQDNHSVVWRNFEASQDVNSIEPASRARTTYVLQEYFIPADRFDAFVPKMAAILQNRHVNVINVAIRHADADPDTLLSWAPKEVFAFVLYYEQGTDDTSKSAVTVWTRELIDASIAEGGDYYLPYQIQATPEQFLRAYPRAPEYFALKRRVDPEYKFRNKLWEAYYNPQP